VYTNTYMYILARPSLVSVLRRLKSPYDRLHINIHMYIYI